MQRVRVGDQVVVISGEHKGSRGKVSRVNLEAGTVVIEGVNQVKRHIKATAQRPGGVLEVEGAIPLSKVMPVDPESGKPTRVKVKTEDGKKTRVAKSGAPIVAQR